MVLIHPLLAVAGFRWCNSGANSVQSISVDSAKFERYQVFATLSLKGLKQESYGSLGDSSAAFQHIGEWGSVRVPPSPLRFKGSQRVSTRRNQLRWQRVASCRFW